MWPMRSPWEVESGTCSVLYRRLVILWDLLDSGTCKAMVASLLADFTRRRSIQVGGNWLASWTTLWCIQHQLLASIFSILGSHSGTVINHILYLLPWLPFLHMDLELFPIHFSRLFSWPTHAILDIKLDPCGISERKKNYHICDSFYYHSRTVKTGNLSFVMRPHLRPIPLQDLWCVVYKSSYALNPTSRLLVLVNFSVA